MVRDLLSLVVNVEGGSKNTKAESFLALGDDDVAPPNLFLDWPSRQVVSVQPSRRLEFHTDVPTSSMLQELAEDPENIAARTVSTLCRKTTITPGAPHPW